MTLKCPVFFLKGGHWGERGWQRVSWYTWLIRCSNFTSKVRWMKYKGIALFPKTRQRLHDHFLHRKALLRARKYAEQLELREEKKTNDTTL